MTPPNRPLFWIASLIRRRASAHPALASDARYAAGRPARTTAGLAPAAMSGIRSIREECAPSAFTGGLQRSASRALAGPRIRTGMRSKLLSYSGQFTATYSKCIERYHAALGFVCIADRS